MQNGCPKCEKIHKENRSTITAWPMVLCLDCQLEQADADVLKAMNRVEEIKQKIKQEQNKKGKEHEKL
jgi:hypothetical protein